MDTKTELEATILLHYNIAPGQIYRDLDPRMTGRQVKVLGVTLKRGKASCANFAGGRTIGKTVWIRFDRLANKRLFALVES